MQYDNRLGTLGLMKYLSRLTLRRKLPPPAVSNPTLGFTLRRYCLNGCYRAQEGSRIYFLFMIQFCCFSVKAGGVLLPTNDSNALSDSSAQTESATCPSASEKSPQRKTTTLSFQTATSDPAKKNTHSSCRMVSIPIPNTGNPLEFRYSFFFFIFCYTSL